MVVAKCCLLTVLLPTALTRQLRRAARPRMADTLLECGVTNCGSWLCPTPGPAPGPATPLS